VRGNLQALFGKRPTEKDPAKGTSPAAYFTLRGPLVQQCTGATRQLLEAPVHADGEVAGLLGRPLAGGMRGGAAQVHTASAVLDEHQDIQPFQQDGADVQEGRRR